MAGYIRLYVYVGPCAYMVHLYVYLGLRVYTMHTYTHIWVYVHISIVVHVSATEKEDEEGRWMGWGQWTVWTGEGKREMRSGGWEETLVGRISGGVRVTSSCLSPAHHMHISTQVYMI